MIAHFDNICHFQHSDVTANLEFAFTLKSKMRWSKNVLDEMDARAQIILGEMNPVFCSILDIVVHMMHTIHSVGMASVDSHSLFCVKKEIISTTLC